MSPLQQFREGIGMAWDALLEGWQQLFRRAGRAITRFYPRGRSGEMVSREDNADVIRNVGWGVLAAEVVEDDEKILVRLEAPGMDREDFDIEVSDGALVVRGEKRYQREDAGSTWYVAECAYGGFQRVIPLPAAVDAKAARASYRQGVLRIELPKAAPRRRIDVKGR